MHRRSSRHLGALLVPLLVLAACADDDGDSTAPTTTADPSDGTEVEWPVQFTGTLDVAVPDADRCELYFDECLAPFPSDRFTVLDDATDSGRRVELVQESMPANVDGVRIDPTEWNRNDGFSPGALIVLPAGAIDPVASALPGVDDIGRSVQEDAPILLLDAATGERLPYWAELDAMLHLDEAGSGPERRALLIRPAANLPEGHRIVVALRSMRDARGEPIEAPDVFRAYRDKLETQDDAVEERRRSMEELFALLADSDVERSSVYLAWDFTVASTRSLTERSLHMRDDAFEALGEAAPAFEVTQVTERGLPEGVLRVVEGEVTVPNYLTDGGEPGSVLNNGDDPDGVPERDGDYAANFLCVVPTVAAETPGVPVLYGHGLLGSVDEARGAGERLGPRTGMVICGTDWIGMATRDVGSIVGVLRDLSGFRMLPDRIQQSMLNVQFLGRAMIHPDGFASDPAFQNEAGASVLGEGLAYVGLSQGGIIGGAVSALAQDWDRVFLGVPAMNYSTLLNRSVDFDEYAILLRQAYPDAYTHQLGFSLIQMLWDRGENNGYAAHLTADPLPDTQPKQVLVFAAYGDHQVTNVATDVMARTMGLRLRTPGLAEGRAPDREPFWGIPAIAELPFEGNGYVMWDFGTPTPPIENLPNRAGEDPHGMGRSSDPVVELVTTFLTTGRIVEVCAAGQPCAGIPEG